MVVVGWLVGWLIYPATANGWMVSGGGIWFVVICTYCMYNMCIFVLLFVCMCVCVCVLLYLICVYVYVYVGMNIGRKKRPGFLRCTTLVRGQTDSQSVSTWVVHM